MEKGYWILRRKTEIEGEIVLRVIWKATYKLYILTNFYRYSIYIDLHAAAAVKSLQSCPTLWDPMDCSPPGFSVHGILQARTLEWVAISFSNAWKWKVKVKSLSHVWFLATPWTAAYQAPPSMGFSGQQYWSGVPLPSPRFTYLYLYISLALPPPHTHSYITHLVTTLCHSVSFIQNV